jgi:thiamine-phosphate pyrophosphorylase
MLRTMPCHHRREVIAARGADLRLISPVFPTRSHPGAPVLGAVRAGLMIRGERASLIALGGMTRERARRMAALGFDGWAAIDAFAR